MCGRYVSAKSASQLQVMFDAVDETGGQLRTDLNVAPTKDVPAVLVDQQPGGEGAEVRRQLRLLRWRLLPFWAKDTRAGNKMINARVKTVAEKPAYRRAFISRRCLLPADGWYEWAPAEGLDLRNERSHVRLCVACGEDSGLTNERARRSRRGGEGKL